MDGDIISNFIPIPANDSEINLYRVETGNLTGAFLRELRKILTPEDWAKINYFSQPKIRERLILSRGLLRVLLSHFLGVKPTELQFKTNPWGKLYLVNYGLQFNLSHSGSALVFALGEGYSVGVDVEQIRPLQCPHRLIQRYGTLGEQTHWQRLPPQARQKYFLELWVAKEAYSKALGTGLTGMLGEFANLHTLNQTRIAPPGGWSAHLQHFSVGQNYVGAVCWGATPGADASIPAQTRWVDHSPR
ncbi:4'-phosphopantetheinyl transferase superfamily protein [Gloeomargaritales cyanobacterium VI4D9]|nr:4'-phosphopantetheinyl transferase superfamily protein [Gloeomargaritales cyanobacterium VI4D9]